MPLFDDTLLAKLRFLSLEIQRLDGAILNARGTREAFFGVDLSDHRDYSPGDDLHAIDWNICARHDELVTRRSRRAAVRHVYLLLDTSASMALGKPAKFDAGRLAVASLAYAAVNRGDPVELAPFSHRMLPGFGPIRDKARILQMASHLETLGPPEGKTDLAAAAEQFAARNQRRGLALVVSDLYDPAGFRRGLDVLRRAGYAPRVVRVFDPEEAAPEALGDWDLHDVETGATWQVTLTQRQLRRYRQQYEQFRQSLDRYCAAHAIWQTEIPCNAATDEVLQRAVGVKR